MSRVDSPTNGWRSVTREHGRIVWADRLNTPVTLPVLPDAAEVEAWARGRARKLLVAKLLWVALALVVGGAVMFGCATAPADAPPQTIVLSEKAGSVAGQLAKTLVAQEPKAATLPDGTIVILRPADADDVCLWAHELRHRNQMAGMGSKAWEIEYARQYVDCRRTGHASAWCLRYGMQLEVQAYADQHRCQEQRGRTSRGDDWGKCLAKGAAR